MQSKKMTLTLKYLRRSDISHPATKWKGGSDASLGCEADGVVMHKPV